MKISYNWLKEYLPADEIFAPYINDINKLADILTSVGLEVENIEKYESVTGSLEGLIAAEILTCEKHPNADKLKITTVHTGYEILQVVCGAPNAAKGQKVILAPPGTRLFPKEGDPFIIKKTKIRGLESNGMICSEDEIGLGNSHEGILVLPDDTVSGTPASEIFPIYKDHIIEIGLTPNRMDAQSHLGVAKDVCAWLTHHTGEKAQVISPLGRPFMPDDQSYHIDVEVKDPELCPRYSGVTISHVNITDSPQWLKNKLNAIGLKPINNVVDITNFILHTTGQPLHAFDADKIEKKQVVVETLPAGTSFHTLDKKERKLNDADIMICDGDDHPMCIAGVFGGLDTGVTASTRNIFLESAVFNPANIRRSIIRHGLRTDAAVRFEKGVDISKTVEVLKYAALLIKELGDGKISSEIVDVFQKPKDQLVDLSFAYLERLSGKHFAPDTVARILKSLGFGITAVDDKRILVKVPSSNPDISLPADIVEEILRISGLDDIEIPRQTTMTAGMNDHSREFLFREKIITWLTGNGFYEIFTNSITNDKYFESSDAVVKIINSLSEELTILRPGMLPTALESIAYNLNRQKKDILFFETGKTYEARGVQYSELDHLCVYCTGDYRKKSWNMPAQPCDIFLIKGIAHALFTISGVEYQTEIDNNSGQITFYKQGKLLGTATEVGKSDLDMFSIRQPVYYLDINFDLLTKIALENKTTYTPVSRFPVVERDLAIVVDRSIPYSQIKKVITDLHLKKLSSMHMFDLYESEKLGKDKKSIAINFSFADPGKTLTDKETDAIMKQIIGALENLNAEIRSHA